MASMGSTKRKNKHKKQHTLSDIKTLGHQLLSSRAHVNNLPILLTYANPNSPPEFVLESLLSLHSFFTPLLPDLPSRSKSPAKPSDQEDPDFIFRTWVRAKFDEFVQALIDLSLSPLSEEALREVVLDTLMESVKIGNRGKFHSAIYHRFIHAIVHCTLETDILSALLVSKYFKYIDVRYFTYISLEKLTKTLESEDISDENNANADSVDEGKSRSSRELVIRKLHHMLSNVPLPENLGEQSEYEMLNGLGVFTKEGNREEHVEISKTKEKHGKKNKSSSNVSPAANVPKKMKSKFTKAWISFLGLSLPVDVYKEVLVNLHHSVIPYLSNPIMLCDFLTRSYDIGGVISVMALSSLFVLMTEHGLEYPNFYEKLYMLLEPSIFIAKHRAKFFQLLDSCLKSPLLPAYLAASFTKKLSRLSLSAPPSGGLVIIALVHNLLRRHPSINCLVHREDCDDTAKDVAKAEHSTDETSNNMKGIDHFNNEERDLVKTNAMRSSLWEIDTLRHHYCPPVSRFVESLKNDLTVRSKTTEVAIKDFCSASYGTIFKEEMRRRIKQVPLSGNKPPTSLFSESDFPGWTFGSKDEAQADDNNKTTNLSEEQDSKRQRIEVS